ncbi:hypothetical protein H5410_016216 [Solanum commersonii]|uniref:Uncharacterized protein n=1 Tax=Solanum commersonii TaxID=4109 RepID=A0A9J5ZVZ0_SOLCO|nr:hypothetical protein H5410_016216 [Solanum commersonii]
MEICLDKPSTNQDQMFCMNHRSTMVSVFEAHRNNGRCRTYCRLLSSADRRGGVKAKKWWRIIPACIWWSVWKERNGRCYENKSNSIQKVKENCIAYLYFWCKQECIEEVEQLVDMLGSL